MQLVLLILGLFTHILIISGTEIVAKIITNALSNIQNFVSNNAGVNLSYLPLAKRAL